MKARWRIIAVASAALAAAGTPALAQDAPAPAQNELIGNPQLRDFSINGTVTRPSEQPVPAPTAPQATGRPAAEQSQAPAQRAPQPQREASQTPRSDARTREEPARTASSEDLPPPTPARRIATPSLVDDQPAELAPEPAFLPSPDEGTLAPSPSELPMLPWLIAALALAGALGWYFLRQRPRESYAGAGAGSVSRFDAPSPAPAPVRTPPPPAAKPSSGLVSTRLRPWLEIELKPQRAVIDGDKAAIAFELSVFNSGSAPARDVLLEAAMFSAGPMQDQVIRRFFDNPVASGERVPVIPPMQRFSIESAVFLTRDQIQPITIEGRHLFVPLIAFNAIYGWSGGTGQSSASYLVGKATKGEKLGPFRLDLGPRVFRTLEAREHELRLRN